MTAARLSGLMRRASSGNLAPAEAGIARMLAIGACLLQADPMVFVQHLQRSFNR